MNTLEIKTNFSKSHIAIVLLILIVVAIIFRVLVFPYDIPIYQDGEVYFWYANDMSLTSNIPYWEDTYFSNTLWPTFLSIFFSSLSSENYIDYMTMQRTVTTGISVITGIAVFFLSRYFVKQEYALIATALFLFEPRLILNSSSGLTEPLFLLLTIVSIVLYLNKRMSLVYVSFGILALATLTRYEAGMLIIPFSLLFFWKNKDSKKIFHLLICLVIFFLIIIAVDDLRSIHTEGDAPKIFDHFSAALLVYESRFENECIIIEEEDECAKTQKSEGRRTAIEDSTLVQTLGMSTINLVKYFGWLTIPLFFVFVPIGLYKFFQNRNFEKWTIVMCIIFMLIPAFYAFSRDFQEIRYLYIQIPLLCVIASFSIEFFNEKINRPKIMMSVFLTSIIITSGIFYYDQSLVDYELEREYFEIAIKINSEMKITNDVFPADKYIRTAKIAELDKFPVLRNSFDLFSLKMISIHDKETLDEFLEYAKKNDLKYLVIDDDGDGVEFLYNIFHNEDNFKFLEKIYDSQNDGYDYHVKFFRINYDKVI